jgi:WD40 repeat protein
MTNFHQGSVNPDEFHYHIGGGGVPADSPAYVRRSADDELYRLLQSGEYCYVLNARQMGKSSLRLQTMARLQAEGVVCGAMDFSVAGATAAEWYFWIVDRLATELKLDDEACADWWEQHRRLPLAARLVRFLQTVVLAQIPGRIVIFLDEIDTTRSLDFSDDFFAALRECYERRPTEQEFRRLAFVLLGVSTPSDLMMDKVRSPFNIGRAIDLQGFQFEEAQSLLAGLVGVLDAPGALRSILAWTGGQPFLTQKVCHLVREWGSQGEEEASSASRFQTPTELVDYVVQTYVIDNWEMQDEPQHLRTIRDRILQPDESRRGALLGLSQQVLREETIAAADTWEQAELRLSGLVVKRGGVLQVYNPIYAAVFGDGWCDRRLGELRPYGEALRAWEKSGDESWLLTGEALAEAKIWRADKNLALSDVSFLDASQALDQRQMEQKLKVKEDANQILQAATVEAEGKLAVAEETAAQKIAVAAKKANRRNLVSLIGAGAALVAAVTFGAAAYQINQSATKAQNGLSEATAKLDTATRDKERAVALADTKLAEAQQKTVQAQQQYQKAQAQTKAAKAQATQAAQQAQAAQQQFAAAQQQVAQANVTLAQVNQEKQVATEAKAQAEQAQMVATEQRDIVKRGTELERKGTALLRLPDDNYYNSYTTLAEALKLGQEMRALLQRENISKSLSNYPAVLPLLALRLKVNTITQQDRNRRFSTSVINGKQTITLYDLTGKQFAKLKGSKLKLDHDSKQILTNDEGNTYLYDLMGKEIAQLHGENARFSPDGKKVIISVETSSRILPPYFTNLYDFTNVNSDWFNITLPYIILGDNARFSSDSNKVISMDKVGTIRISNLLGKIIFERPGTIPSPRICASRISDNLRINSISVSPDTPAIYLCNLDLLEQKLADFTNNPYPTFISDDGHRIVIGSDVGKIQLHDLMNNKSIEFQGDYGRFSPDRTQILTMSDDSNTLRRYSLTGEKLAEFSEKSKIIFPIFSPNGKTILSTVLTEDADISRLYDLTGQPIRDFPGIVPIFSSDGRLILTTFQGEDITRLYDLDGNLLAEYLGSTFPRDPNYYGLSLGFNKDSTQIRTFTSDGTLRVWDIDAGLTIDGGLTDLINRGCAQLKNFRHREDVRKVCPEGN